MSCAQIAADPVEEPRQSAGVFLRHRTRNELRLIAIPMRWDDQSLSDHVGDLRAVVATHEMHEHVEARGGSGRRHHTALIHIKCIRLHGQTRVALLKPLRVTPMRRDRLALEDARCCEHEDTGTDRTDARAALMSSANLAHQRLGRRLIGIAPARHDDRMRLIENPERMWRGYRHTACSTQRPSFSRAHREPIPGHTQLGTVQREHLDHTSKLERAQPVISDRHHELRFR